MSMDAGDLDRRVEFIRRQDGKDALNSPVENWVLLFTRWAKVRYGSGTERRIAAEKQAAQTATITIRKTSATAGLTEKDRARFDAADWDISAIKPDRDALEITATRGGK